MLYRARVRVIYILYKICIFLINASLLRMLRHVVDFSPLGLVGSMLGTSDGTTPAPTNTAPVTMYPILHLCAKNDYYGNPQRLYVMSDEEGKFIQCWDEGYNGYHAVPEELRNEAYLAQRVNVSVTKYKQLLRTLPTSKVSKESFLKVAS